jgi:hypothetical protein
MFSALLSPNFMPTFGKISEHFLRYAVTYVRTDVRTDLRTYGPMEPIL